MLKKYYALAAALILAAAAFCSCSEKNNSVRAEKKIADFIPITEVREDSRNYYLIVKDIDDQYWKLLSKGAALSGNELEVNVYMSGSSDEAEIDQQIALADKAVQLGADAIIIAPDDAVKLSDCVSRIHKSGIPVVLTDTIVNCRDYDACFMTDNMLAGQAAAKELIDEMHKNKVSDNEEANVIILSGTISSPSLNERVAGFSGYWCEHAPKNWKLLDDVRKSGNYNEALNNARGILSKYDNIKGVFAVNYYTASGCASAIKEMELTDTALICFDYPDEINDLMRQKEYTVSSVLQRTYDMGYEAVKECYNICNGEKPKSKYIDMGINILNPETQNTPQIQKILSQY